MTMAPVAFSSILLSFQLLLLLIGAPSVNTQSTPESSPYEGLVTCVYAISGTYEILPRLLYYLTLVFAIFGRNQEWLVIGALVSALTYAGTSAIHTMALVSSKAAVFDLDLVGAWAILTTGALSYITLINWSDTLRNSRAKVVMICWGCLVGVSLIFGRSALFDTHIGNGEPACYSPAGKLLEYPYQLEDPTFNCTYKCFSARKPMRGPSEIIAVPTIVVKGQYSRLGLVLVGPVMFTAYAAVSFDSREHTPSQLCTRYVMHLLNPKHHAEITRSIYNASSERWYGGYFVLFHYVHRARWNGTKLMIYFLIMPWVVLGFVIDILCIPLLVLNVVLNEVNIIGSQLPTNEASYAIGQWGPIVASLLVVVAAIINKFLEIREASQAANDIPRQDVIEPRVAGTAVEDLEGQVTGVVFKKLQHQETLRDMEEILAASRKCHTTSVLAKSI